MFFSTYAFAAVDKYNVPSALEACLAKSKDLALDDRMNPFYLQADFDGNHRNDYAVLITQTTTGKKGIAVCLAQIGGKWTLAVLGGGTKVALEGGALADDLADFDAWKLEETSVQKRYVTGIHLIAKEAGSGVFHWDGKKFRWHQLGI